MFKTIRIIALFFFAAALTIACDEIVGTTVTDSNVPDGGDCHAGDWMGSDCLAVSESCPPADYSEYHQGNQKYCVCDCKGYGFNP